MIRLEEFETKTGGRLDALDITDDVQAVVDASGARSGAVLVFLPHTTCAVLVAPVGQSTVQQIERAMAALAPPDGYYAHDDLTRRTENLVEDEPANAPAHLFHVFYGSACARLPIEEGRVVIDGDDRLLFLELDCSRARRYLVQVVGD